MGGADTTRRVFLGNDEENEKLRREHKYAENRVVTSKYSLLSFLPKTMFEFFRGVSNCYFLFISILQLATTLSPTNPYTTAGPLLVVLIISMVKQGIEDQKRHKADGVQNARKCRILGAKGEEIVKQWRALQVGDILCLRDHDEAPADIFILSTSEEEGRCFVETCNLDGETNLKRRGVIEQVAKHIGYRNLNDPPLAEDQHAKKMMQFTGMMEYEQPNNRLYNFTGRIEFEAIKETAPIGPSNIILRGCSIRGCSYLYGIVIFTGPETKLMQNARATPSKQSSVAHMVNWCILIVFGTQITLCAISTISNAVWVDEYASKKWYLGSVISSSSGKTNIENFFTFVILYNNLVPISLYVTLDMVKVVQAKNIALDEEMCHEGKYAIARTSDLNEELGQVEYIFSDKTGTLTRNIMEFRKCFVHGISYGFGTTEIGRAVAELAKKAADGDQDKKIDGPDVGEEKHEPRDAQVNFDQLIHFDDPRLINALDQNTPAAAGIDEFLTMLSVCHTVIPEVNKKDGSVEYRASSPDEEALVKAAKCLGYNFITPAPMVEVEVKTKSGAVSVRKYTVLNVNEFNSTRKRMSVVVRTEDDRYVLYCKGADNVILPRSREDGHTEILNDELKRFASEGLRTLVLAKKELSEAEYNEWNASYQAAVTSLTNRDDMLAEVAEALEQDMSIVGATAIEDKLQEGVPNAIFNLAQAGIKIWMLTGDKEETAINIGHACRLINERMKLLIINKEDLKELKDQVDTLYNTEDVQTHLKTKKVSSRVAIVCDGKSLVHVFPPKTAKTPEIEATAKDLARKLLEMSSICQALIACRVSPAQKADIVSLVRYQSPKKVVTLAVGDGANDVNMIQSAHVGVGISGQEGVQAVNASDYAVAQFRFLERLLLVHGRYNYHRVSKVIMYSFYKNVALVIALFMFNFYNGESGTSIFDSFIMAGWNFFLALPIMLVGVADEDISPEQVLRYPSLYIPGQKSDSLNVYRFAWWIFIGIGQALLCFLLTIAGTAALDPANTALNLEGTIVYSMLLMSSHFRVILETRSWTMLNVFVIALSIGAFFLFLVIYPPLGWFGDAMDGVSSRVLSSEAHWLLLLLIPFSVNIIATCIKYIQSNSTMADVLREKLVLQRTSAKVACDPGNLSSPRSGRMRFHKDDVNRKGSTIGMIGMSPIVAPSKKTELSFSASISSNVTAYRGFAFSAPDTSDPSKQEEITTLKANQFQHEGSMTHTLDPLDSLLCEEEI
ncbi:hypothetical protein Poli38472_002434 [Pythium oligandrum]|uniref:Phospholipid-transporting ATPase n=1 Tax=Pythium oligandrum TaxID=41045 RepID=A0A8K1FMB5_PYTOL|nr:hypothetical protein Poli38472_002434 [Pythium oligandrum]|eukprot:TMW63493.1 hypothetical protein Poli38472_002434 [Pythium oligandrum]